MMKLKTVEKYFEENPDVTVLGFAWSCYWRMMLAFLGVYVCFAIVAIFFAGIASI